MIAERIALHLPARLAGPFMDFARDCVPRDTPVSVGMLAREKDPGAAFYWLWHGQGMPQELYDGVRDLLPEKWEDYETGDREVAMARAYLRPGDAEVIDRAMAECGIKYSTFSTYNGHANGTRERPDFLLISAVLHRLPVRKAVAVVSGMGLPDTWVDLDEWRLRNV